MKAGLDRMANFPFYETAQLSIATILNALIVIDSPAHPTMLGFDIQSTTLSQHVQH